MRWGVFAALTLAACSRQALDVGSRRDAAVDAGADARALVEAGADAARVGIDAGVVIDAALDATPDASPEASAPGHCCSASGVTTDCGEVCVPTDVTFDRMWPCPTVGRCVQSVRFDGRRVLARDAVGDTESDYYCNGSVLLAPDGGLLGRYDVNTEVLLFGQESYCASDACRALWQVDGCQVLFDGQWQSPSTGSCPGAYHHPMPRSPACSRVATSTWQPTRCRFTGDEVSP